MSCPPALNLYVKVWTPIEGRAFERLLGPSDGALVNGIRVLIKDAQRSASFVPCKVIMRRHRSWPRSLESAGPLILDFLASRTMRNDVCCLGHSVYGIFVIAAQTD